MNASPLSNRHPAIRSWALRCVMIALSVTCSLTGGAALHAQAVPHIAWRDAIKLIDSTSPADVTAAIDKLQSSLRDPAKLAPAEAAMALALLQTRQGDYDQAMKTLTQMATTYEPNALNSVRGAMLRVALVRALDREDAASAEAAFKDLVRIVVAEKADSLELRLSAHTIGATVGMLDHDQSGNLIGRNVLKIGRECMHRSKAKGVETGFLAELNASTERTQIIRQSLEEIAAMGLDEFKKQHAARLEALKLKMGELSEQKELTNEVIRNTREQIDQNTLDQRKLLREINSINAQLRQPTPGHPGVKRLPPPLPPPAYSIYVNEYETITERETRYENGERIRVPVTRQVRRSQYDIERERDLIHNRMMSEYSLAKATYDQYAANYDASLASWVKADQHRRQELNAKKSEAESKRQELLAANKAIQGEQAESAKELKSKRTEKEQEAFELEMQAIAISAASAGKPQLAFRPQNFVLMQWTQEKLLLEKFTK